MPRGPRFHGGYHLYNLAGEAGCKRSESKAVTAVYVRDILWVRHLLQTWGRWGDSSPRRQEAAVLSENEVCLVALHRNHRIYIWF